MIGRIVDIVFLKIISGLLFSIGVIVHSVLIWFHVSSKYKALLSTTLGIIGLIIFYGRYGKFTEENIEEVIW